MRLTTPQCHATLKKINDLIPANKPKIYLDIIGYFICGIDVIRLDKDLEQELGINDDNRILSDGTCRSTKEMAIEVYGEQIALLIEENLSAINNYGQL